MTTTRSTLCVTLGAGRWLAPFLAACAQASDASTPHHVHWMVVDPKPLSGAAWQDALAQGLLQGSVHHTTSDAKRHKALTHAARMLGDRWPSLTPNTHVMTWPQPRSNASSHNLPVAVPITEAPRVTLHVIVAPVRDALRNVLGSFDALWWLVDNDAGPPIEAIDRHSLKGLARLSQAQARLHVMGPPAVIAQARLEAPRAGFVVDAATTSPTTLNARYAPRGPTVDRLERLGAAQPKPSHVLVLGAGLAGAHVARALALRGIRSTVLDRQPQAAAEGSGGSAGIYHGTVHATDGAHARLFRAAALQATVWHREAMQAGVEGHAGGLLRWSEDDPNQMQERLTAQQLPFTWVQGVTAQEAQALSSVTSTQPAAWHFPSGGWINPRALVAWCLQHPLVQFVGAANVHALLRRDGRWAAVDRHGVVLGSASHVVLANAWDAARLCPHAAWPLSQTRGQSTQLPSNTPGLVAPRMAVSGNGYALTAADGCVHVGASSSIDDDASAPRDSDTHDNLHKLAFLTGSTVNRLALADSVLQHRVGWRAATPDKLPIVGAVPRWRDGDATASRVGVDQAAPPRVAHHAHQVPREAGLYVLAGLGSRGLTLAPLMAQVVVASMLREPVPLEADLMDVVDAARFVAKRARVA